MQKTGKRLGEKTAKAKRAATAKQTQKAARNRARAERLAAGVVAGRTVTELARDEGLSRQHTSSLVNGAQVTHIITALVSANEPRVHELFTKVLQAIDDALENGNAYATEKIKEPDGSMRAERILLGPDHYARMAAAKVFVSIICAGRAAPKPVDPMDLRPAVTLEELDRLLAEKAAAEREAAQ